MCNFTQHTNKDHSFVHFQIWFYWFLRCLCQLSLSLLSDVRAQQGGRRTPWTHLWTQPGITSDTQTLRTQWGMKSRLLKLEFPVFCSPFWLSKATKCQLRYLFFLLLDLFLLKLWQLLAQIAQVLFTLCLFRWKWSREKAAQVSPAVGG